MFDRANEVRFSRNLFYSVTNRFKNLTVFTELKNDIWNSRYKRFKTGKNQDIAGPEIFKSEKAVFTKRLKIRPNQLGSS